MREMMLQRRQRLCYFHSPCDSTYLGELTLQQSANLHEMTSWLKLWGQIEKLHFVNQCEQTRETILPNTDIEPYAFYRAMLRSNSAVVPQYVVRPTVCPSVCVMFRSRDHIEWNTSKIISRLHSIRYTCSEWPKHQRFGPTGTSPKLGWNRWGAEKL